MKFILPAFFMLFSVASFSQRPGKRVDVKDSISGTTANVTANTSTSPTYEGLTYSELRVKLTRPPYGLENILVMIKKIKSDEESNRALNVADYNSLTLREKFTYNMIHAESYSQNCDAMPAQKNEDQKIFAYLPDAFGEYAWSERQTKFFSGNRDSVIQFMRESMGRTKRAGINFKQAMLEINAREMIPDIIATFRAGKVKDLDLLTVLMNLMKDNEYEPFLVSGSYKKLYAAETSYKSYLNDVKSNEDLIIKRAMDFYNADKKK
jgi:hypothetical protein